MGAARYKKKKDEKEKRLQTIRHLIFLKKL
jgi:hypothetical protein